MYSSIDLARFIVDQINDKCSTLYASFTDDFCSTGNIRIESLVSPGNLPIGDYVYNQLCHYCRCHLFFQSSDESADVSFWKVI